MFGCRTNKGGGILNEKTAVTRKIKCLHSLIKKNFDNSDFIKEYPDMTSTKGFVIGYIFKKSEKKELVYQKDIERDFSISRSSASELLNNLENQDLITRVAEESDQRMKRISLTDKSNALMMNLRETMLGTNKKMVSGFTQEEIDLVDSFIDRMIENLKKEDE